MENSNLSSEELADEAAAAAVVLLVTVMLLNAFASFAAKRIKKTSGEI